MTKEDDGGGVKRSGGAPDRMVLSLSFTELDGHGIIRSTEKHDVHGSSIYVVGRRDKPVPDNAGCVGMYRFSGQMPATRVHPVEMTPSSHYRLGLLGLFRFPSGTCEYVNHAYGVIQGDGETPCREVQMTSIYHSRCREHEIAVRLTLSEPVRSKAQHVIGASFEIDTETMDEMWENMCTWALTMAPTLHELMCK
jgi:hypothetical protein